MARTPSWLQINEENFKDLLDYLQENANNKDKDPFFAAACELLDGRVERLIPTLAEDLDAEEGIIRFRICLLGAWLLCYPDRPARGTGYSFVCLHAYPRLHLKCIRCICSQLRQKPFHMR